MRNRNLDKQYVVTGFPFSLWNMTYATPLPHAWEWKKLRELTLHIYKCDPKIRRTEAIEKLAASIESPNFCKKIIIERNQMWSSIYHCG